MAGGEESKEDKATVNPPTSEETEEDMPPAYDETSGLTVGGVPEVKIAPSETKIDMGGKGEKEEDGFQGLTKEELMKFANDPFWVRLRWALFILFWVIWVAMLVASVVIIVYAPKCPSPEPKSWWQKSPIYKVDLDEFPTPDGSTPSTLQDLTNSLDYLVKAGVGTLYLTSLYSSFGLATAPSSLDSGLEAKYGNMADWTALVAGLKERYQHVVVDFVPNHTSDEHEWFVKSQAGDPEYADYYVWSAGGGSASPPPGQSWTWSEARGSWYLTRLGQHQPDLNLANARVLQKQKDNLRFWIDNGVDGFMVNDLPYLMNDSEDKNLVQELLHEFRDLLDEETEKSGSPKVLMGDLDIDSKLDLTVDSSPLHLDFTHHLFSDLSQETLTAQGLNDTLLGYVAESPTWPSISLTPPSTDLLDALTMFRMLLPATSIYKAGEELGLPAVNWEAVAEQEAATESHLNLFSTLSNKLRHQDSILFGELNYNTTVVLNETVFGMTRVKKGNPGYLFAINLGEELMVANFTMEHVPDNIRLMARSTQPLLSEGAAEVRTYKSQAVPVKPNEGKIFTFVPKFED